MSVENEWNKSITIDRQCENNGAPLTIAMKSPQ